MLMSQPPGSCEHTSPKQCHCDVAPPIITGPLLFDPLFLSQPSNGSLKAKSSGTTPQTHSCRYQSDDTTAKSLHCFGPGPTKRQDREQGFTSSTTVALGSDTPSPISNLNYICREASPSAHKSLAIILKDAYIATCWDTCNTLQHTSTRCNTLQHTATHCNTLPQGSSPRRCTRPDPGGTQHQGGVRASAIHEWSGKGLQYMLGATKRSFLAS